jgi:hypothetical protein
MYFYVYEYICNLYEYIYTHMYTYICTYVCAYLRILKTKLLKFARYINVYEHMHKCLYIQTYMHRCIYIHKYSYIYIIMYIPEDPDAFKLLKFALPDFGIKSFGNLEFFEGTSVNIVPVFMYTCKHISTFKFKYILICTHTYSYIHIYDISVYPHAYRPMTLENQQIL